MKFKNTYCFLNVVVAVCDKKSNNQLLSKTPVTLYYPYQPNGSANDAYVHGEKPLTPNTLFPSHST